MEKEELKKKIEEWKKQYGDIYELHASWTVEGKELRRSFILRKPDPGLFEMLMAGIMDKKASKAFRNLIIACVLDPSVEEFNRLADVYSAMPMALGNKLLEETGINADVVKKKL